MAIDGTPGDTPGRAQREVPSADRAQRRGARGDRREQRVDAGQERDDRGAEGRSERRGLIDGLRRLCETGADEPRDLRPVLGGMGAEHRLVDACRLGLEDQHAGVAERPERLGERELDDHGARAGEPPDQGVEVVAGLGLGQREQLRAHRETRALEVSVVTGTPDMTAWTSAASATERAIGPPWSSDGASGMTPSSGTAPWAPLSPTTPQNADGPQDRAHGLRPDRDRHLPSGDRRRRPGRRAARRVLS